MTKEDELVTKTKDESNPTREIGSNFKASFKSRGVVSDELVGFSGFCLDIDRSAAESVELFSPSKKEQDVGYLGFCQICHYRLAIL